MYMPDALRALVNLSSAPRERLKHRMYNIAAMSPRADEIAAVVAQRIPGVRITFKSDPMRQAIVDSWPQALDDKVAAAEWRWKAEWDLERMTDDLLAKVRAMSGVAAPPPAPAAKPAAKPAAATTAKPAAKAPAPKPVAAAKGAKK